MINALRNHCGVRWWKNFENLSTSAEVMGKNQCGCTFFWAQCILAALTILLIFGWLCCFVVHIYVTAYVCSCCSMEDNSRIPATSDLRNDRQRDRHVYEQNIIIVTTTSTSQTHCNQGRSILCPCSNKQYTWINSN